MSFTLNNVQLHELSTEKLQDLIQDCKNVLHDRPPVESAKVESTEVESAKVRQRKIAGPSLVDLQNLTREVTIHVWTGNIHGYSAIKSISEQGLVDSSGNTWGSKHRVYVRTIQDGLYHAVESTFHDCVHTTSNTFITFSLLV